MSDKEVS